MEKKLRASGGTADALASGASVRKDVGVQIPPRAQITHIIAPTQAAIPDLRFGPGQAFDPVLILRGALTGNHASPPTSAANIDAASACMPGMMC